MRMYNSNGLRTKEALESLQPELPEAVRRAAIDRNVPLDELFYNALSDYWYVEDYKGMFLGIERDGYAHT